MNCTTIKNKSKNTIIFYLAALIIILSGLYGCSDAKVYNDLSNEITLQINEYQIHNENTLRNSLWDTPDWIEIYNYGTEDIWLGDKYLSDDSYNLIKFNLPDLVIEPESYIIVYASSQTNEIDNEVHANFKLGENDTEIFLSTKSDIIDSCKVENLPVDTSAGVNEKGKWVCFKTPTPGFKNNGLGNKNLSIKAEPMDVLSIVISEYMSSNTYTIKDSYDKSPDWIELYNPNDEELNLCNYFISDDIASRGKCRLPDYTLGAGEYVILYADDEAHIDNGTIYIPFSLGRNDINIVVSAYNGVEVDVCNIEPLPVDISAGLDADGSWAYFAQPTPKEPNSTKPSRTYDIVPDRISDSPIVINEVMSNNKYGLLDIDGDSSDWIELYNPTNYEISMDGYALSDDLTKLDKWVFPKGTVIQPGEYLVVFMSDKNKVKSGELHASFALSSTDERIMLVDNKGAIASTMDIEQMPGNVSKGRLENNDCVYFLIPTPGSQNSGRYETEMKKNEDIYLFDIYISEVSAGKINYNQNSFTAFEEYIELHNSSQESMNLLGFTISDDSQSWTFPYIILGPNKYICLQLKGSTIDSHNVINVDMSISSNGENLILKNPSGVIIDYFSTGFLAGDVSSGRVEGEGSKRYFFANKTPNKKNSREVLTSYCTPPAFSQSGGMINEDSILLTLKCKEGEIIRYTTDGKSPVSSSPVYTEPIFIVDDTAIRAATFAEGKLSSSIVTRTFIFKRKHDLPIVCLTTDPVYLFSSSGGIYAEGPGYVESEPPHIDANYWKNWECKIAFEYYDENNQLGLDFDAGLQIAGQFSRMYDQKSLVVRLRDEYGLDEVYYPFFENSDVDEYKHILLRTSGQDIGITKIKDYYIHQSVKDYTEVDVMEGRPVAVYLNGEYWGLYNLREKQNEDYLASHYGIDKDDVTIVKNINTLLSGSMDEWNELSKFINNNNFADDELYKELAEKVDVDAFIDYIAIQVFYGNYDMGNVKYWKENDGGKWRPMLYDTDMALVEETSHINYFEAYFKPSNYSLIFNALFQNQGFRDKFTDRYAYFLNEVFTKEKIVQLINELANQIDNEISYQDARFNTPSSYEKWRENIEEMKEIAIGRRYISIEHLKIMFNLDDEKIKELFDWYE